MIGLGGGGEGQDHHGGPGEPEVQLGDGADLVKVVQGPVRVAVQPHGVGPHGLAQGGEVAPQVPGAQEEHGGVPEGPDRPQVLPQVGALLVPIGGQPLHQGEKAGEQMLRDGGAVGPHG